MTVVGNPADDVKQEDVNKVTEDKPVEEKATEKNEKENVFDRLDEDSQAVVDEDTEDIEESSRIPGRTTNIAEERVRINADQYSPTDLIITTAEKAKFIESMITGERYTQTFSIFGGKISVTVRSRTADETHALYAYIRHTLAAKEGENSLSAVEGDMAYVPLVAQIAELNGVSYPEMKTPLTYEESDGVIKEPGWYQDFKTWKSKPEGLTSALISCVQLFEYKYWTMTKEAGNKNFWKTDTSIEE